MLLQLFWTFIVIGFVSFGGGYSMLPVIEHEVAGRGWMTVQQFADLVAVAGMSPGPIAANAAILVGYHTAELPGAAAAAAGIVLPSLLIVLAVGMLLAKFRRHSLTESAFYGLRPVIAAFIFYAAFRFAASAGLFQTLQWNLHTIGFAVIFAGAFAALLRYRVHPLLVIAVSGLAGVALYA